MPLTRLTDIFTGNHCVLSPPKKPKKLNSRALGNGGRGGIRTHGRIAPTPDFESGAFNHSATLPHCCIYSVFTTFSVPSICIFYTDVLYCLHEDEQNRANDRTGTKMANNARRESSPQREIRKLGGAIYCDRRYGRVFTGHNGAQSYYAGRGFRGSLKV